MPAASLSWDLGSVRSARVSLAGNTRKSQGSSLVDRKKEGLTLAAKASQCSMQKNSNKSGGAACAGRPTFGRREGRSAALAWIGMAYVNYRHLHTSDRQPLAPQHSGLASPAHEIGLTICFEHLGECWGSVYRYLLFVYSFW